MKLSKSLIKFFFLSTFFFSQIITFSSFYFFPQLHTFSHCNVAMPGKRVLVIQSPMATSDFLVTKCRFTPFHFSSPLTIRYCADYSKQLILKQLCLVISKITHFYLVLLRLPNVSFKNTWINIHPLALISP